MALRDRLPSRRRAEARVHVTNAPDRPPRHDGAASPPTPAPALANDAHPALPPDASPRKPDEARVLDVLVRRVEATYGWWDKAYSTAAETALSFVGLTIIVALLVLEAIPGSDPFDSTELVAFVTAATVITLAGVLGKAMRTTGAAQAQKGANDALLAAAQMRKRADDARPTEAPRA